MPKQTDLLLINPPLTLKERYGKLAAGGDKMAPLGLCYLAASARQAGFNVGIIDAEAQNFNPQVTANKILAWSPKVAGITAVSASIYNAAAVAEAVKKKNPGISIVLGGQHVSAAYNETMQRFPQFDFGIIGEGELALTGLLNNLLTAKPVKDLPGLVMRENGAVRFLSPSVPIENLDELPLPAWDLLEGFPHKYTLNIHAFGRMPAASLVVSRGCYGKCVFCDRSVFGNKLRFHGSQYVIRMLKYLIKNYNIKEITFQDDNFLASTERVREICASIIKEKLGISWTCHARVDDVDPEILKMLKMAGCWEIAYGFESGSQKILDILRKGTTVEQAVDAIKMTKRAGIRARGFFVIGSPGERPDDLKKTIDFALNNELEAVSMMNFTPFPGTEIYKEAERHGIFENNWRKMNMYTPIFIPRDLTKEQILIYSKKFFICFYFRIRIIWGHFKNIRSFKHFIKLVRSALGVVQF